MIFALAKDNVTLFLMLTEKDVQNIRGGRTVFVDGRQLGKATFGRVVVSLHKTDKAALDIIRRSGNPVPEEFQAPEPGPNEGRCTACNGCIPEPLLFEGKCTQCWAEEAKRLRVQRN